MSTGYQAGVDTSDVVLSYAEESVWGIKPAVAFKALRMNSEGFTETKSRARPGEIRSDGQVAHGVTTQVEASGQLAFGVSYGTYDDLLKGLVNGSWTSALAIDGVAADITLTSGTSKLTSGTGSKFASIVVGQFIRLFGFNTNPTNNGIYRVSVKTSDTDITLVKLDGVAIITETPTGTNAKIRGSMLRNGVVVNSYYVQKKLASALFLNNSGCFVSGGALTAQLGGFFEGSLQFVSKDQTKFTSDQSTGAVTAAPTGRVVDNVSGFGNVLMDDVSIGQVLTAIEVNVAKDGARAQFGLGSSAAQGIGRGTVNVSGKLTMYFKDFTMYDKYKAETDHMVTFRVLDDQGAGYVVTLPSVTLLNPDIVAGGPDSDVMAEFEFEANPHATLGCTIQLDKMPATAA